MRTVEIFGTSVIPLAVEEIGKDGTLLVGYSRLKRDEVVELHTHLGGILQRTDGTTIPLAEYCEQCESYGCKYPTDEHGYLKSPHN